MNRPQLVFVAFFSLLFAASCACYGAGIEATLLVPPQGAQVSGAKVEIAIGYNTGSLGSVTRMELAVDGAQVGSKVMDVPRSHGVASFLWDSRLAANGKHKFEVSIFAGSKLIGTVSGSLTSSNQASSSPVATVKFENIKNGSVLSGSTNFKISISGMSSNPMVAVLVDKNIKGISGNAPYNFTVNTTDLSEGRHKLEAYATDEAGNRVEAQPVEVVVQNKTPVPTVASATPPKTAAKTQVAVSVKPVPKKITAPNVAAKTTVAKPEVIASAKKTAAPAPVKSAPASIVKVALKPPAPKATVQTPSAGRVEPSATTVATATEKPVKTSVSVSGAAPVKATPKPTVVKPTTKPGPDKLPVHVAKTATPTAKTPAPPAAKVTVKPTSLRPSIPPVRMAWAPPAAKKVGAESKTSVAVAQPKLEPQDSVPPVKAIPLAPRVAQATNPAVTAPTITKPTVALVPTTTPKPKPAGPPAVAKTATTPRVKATPPEVVAPVVAKAPVATSVKPQVIAKATEPTPVSASPSTAESQQATQKMMDVSLRWALQMAGLNVSFADDGRVVRGSDGAKTIEFQVGAREVLVGDHVVVLPSPVTSVGGRAMIPLSFIVEQLGLALKDPSLMKPQEKTN